MSALSVTDDQVNDQAKNLNVIVAEATPDVSGNKLPLFPIISRKPNIHTVNDFLNRPKLMYTYTGTGSVTAPIFQTPVSDYLNNVDVMYKMKFNNLLRATCKVMFVLTTHPYATGMFVAASFYGTFASSNVNVLDTGLVFANLMTKNHVILDCGTVNTATLIIPISARNPYLELSSGTDVNWSIFNFGLVTTPVMMNSQDGSAPAWTMKVYVSLSDIDLTVPVGMGGNATYTMMEKQETKHGPISFPASIVSTIGKTLSSVPVRGPFAFATSLIADGVGAIASLFGFSRPRSLETRNFPHEQEYTLYAGNTLVKTLPEDPMQEVVLSNAFLGEPEDPLSYKNIICRYGVMNLSTWISTHTAYHIIYQLPISPNMCLPYVSNAVQMTPLCYGSQLYSCWRGTLKFRMTVPANSFVRGKLEFKWNPTLNAEVASAYPEYAPNSPGWILDLSCSNIVECEIPYVNSLNYLPLFLPGYNPSTPDSTGAGLTYNGYLLCFVLEPLVALANPMTLNIITEICAGDDFELHIPTSVRIQYIRRELYNAAYSSHTYVPITEESYAYPSLTPGPQITSIDMAYATYTMMSNENAPVQEAHIKLMPFNDTDYTVMHAMGSRTMSFRVLLKKFHPYYNSITMWTYQPNQYWYMNWFFPYIPIEPLFQTLSGPIYAYPPFIMTPTRYLLNLFYGVRGAIRYLYQPMNFEFADGLETSTPMRINAYRDFDVPFSNRALPDKNLSWIFAELPSCSGEASFMPLNESICVELPHQFVHQYQTTSLNSSYYSTPTYGIRFATWCGVKGTTGSESSIQNFRLLQSVGEDFNPFGWNGIPIVAVFPPGGTPSSMNKETHDLWQQYVQINKPKEYERVSHKFNIQEKHKQQQKSAMTANFVDFEVINSAST